METNVQCPNCGAEIVVDLVEPICLCPLCFAIGANRSCCKCEECSLQSECVKDCERWPMDGQ
jgi:hypothetical protein